MRKITKEAKYHFDNWKNWKKSNTETKCDGSGGIHLLLFNNKIALKKEAGVLITDAGHCTATTQERLKSVSDLKLRRNKGKWIVNEKEEWDGEWKFVDDFKK